MSSSSTLNPKRSQIGYPNERYSTGA